MLFFFSAVFCCFTLVIMHTKINYMQNDCYELDPVSLHGKLCDARKVTVSACFRKRGSRSGVLFYLLLLLEWGI